MFKLILPVAVLTLLIWGIFQIVPHVPKEMWYTYAKKTFSVLSALIVTVIAIFVFVQLF